jgi:glycosyltransferase involved in cell wall biosynthesis
VIIVPILLALYVAGSLAYWLGTAHAMFRVRRAAPVLAGLNPPEPARWPKLSVVVPARDEAAEIGPALQSLLDEDYPDLEIILVDDRSTDATGAIMDRAAARNGRVKAVHLAALPEGWLGKIHALHRGLEASAGEFVLFTDADVQFNRGTLRKAVAYCLEQRLDQLAAYPDLRHSGFLLDATISAFIRQLILATRPWRVRDPASTAFAGIGAFNLVRRAAFDATPGFEWLRLEVADDMGLGLMMKRSGARCAVVSARGSIGLHWHRSIRSAARGAEKGYANVLRFSLLRAGVIALLAPALELAPVLALLPLCSARLRPVGYGGIAVFLAYVLSVVLLVRWTKSRTLPALLSPFVTAPIYFVVILRAGILGRRRGGVLWRDTFYPEKTLRDGMRVRF